MPHSHLHQKVLTDGPGLCRGDAGYLRQPFRLTLHDLECIFSKMGNDPCCHFWTDSLDNTAGEIAYNIRGGLGQQPLQKFRLKLTSVAGVAVPFTCYHQLLAHNRQGNRAHNSNGLSILAGKPQDGIAVFIILIDNSSDHAL